MAKYWRCALSMCKSASNAAIFLASSNTRFALHHVPADAYKSSSCPIVTYRWPITSTAQRYLAQANNTHLFDVLEVILTLTLTLTP